MLGGCHPFKPPLYAYVPKTKSSMAKILKDAHLCLAFSRCTVIEDIHHLGRNAITHCQFSPFNFLLKCKLKDWVLAHSYDAMLAYD